MAQIHKQIEPKPETIKERRGEIKELERQHNSREKQFRLS